MYCIVSHRVCGKRQIFAVDVCVTGVSLRMCAQHRVHGVACSAAPLMPVLLFVINIQIDESPNHRTDFETKTERRIYINELTVWCEDRRKCVNEMCTHRRHLWFQ